MTSKLIYFGNRERMAWVKAPAFNPDISKVGWSAALQFLNGGAGLVSSATSHKVYSLSWNLASAEDTAAITDYNDGIYGEGLIYFLDPFAMATNVLPSFWSAPRLAAEDAPPLVKNQVPLLTSSGTNTFAYPAQSAVYTLASDSTFASLYIPLPTGYTFHFGAHGTATGTAKFNVTSEGTSPSTTATTLLPVNASQRTNFSVDGSAAVTGVTISLAGTGTITLAGLIGQVRPTGVAVPNGNFISGRGHSGCEFSSVTVQGYSAPEALDFQSVTATLVETGAWL